MLIMLIGASESDKLFRLIKLGIYMRKILYILIILLSNDMERNFDRAFDSVKKLYRMNWTIQLLFFNFK